MLLDADHADRLIVNVDWNADVGFCGDAHRRAPMAIERS